MADTPATYRIEKADLYAPEVHDICQARDAAFLRNLLLEVSKALPAGTSEFDFTRFDVVPGPHGAGYLALVQFQARAKGSAQAEAMYAKGPFAPDDCTVGALTIGLGQGPSDVQE